MKKYFVIGIITFAAVSIMSCEKDESTDGTGSSVNLKRDLACYINFDAGNADDYSGNGYNGVFSKNAKTTTDTPNGKGQALSLDGTSEQFVNIPYDIIGDSTNYTLSIWIKDFGTGALISSIGGNELTSPSLYISSNCNFCYNVNGNNKQFTQDIAYLQTNMWHHIVLTASRKQNNATLYVDGQKFDTSDISYIASNGTKIQIGGNADGDFDAWSDPMLVDNFRVYRRCISTKEVKELYNEERQ